MNDAAELEHQVLDKVTEVIHAAVGAGIIPDDYGQALVAAAEAEHDRRIIRLLRA